MIELQQKVGFTKEDTVAIKGIALLMMLFHHCFWNAEFTSQYALDYSPFNQESIVSIGMFFKICVSIFAFITGYGLVLS